jgi:hypothetical protein
MRYAVERALNGQWELLAQEALASFSEEEELLAQAQTEAAIVLWQWAVVANGPSPVIEKEGFYRVRDLDTGEIKYTTFVGFQEEATFHYHTAKIKKVAYDE